MENDKMLSGFHRLLSGRTFTPGRILLPITSRVSKSRVVITHSK